MKRALAILALLLAAALPAQPPAMEVAVLETSLGTMVVQLFEKDAPQTVANFRKLVQEGFYDGRPFYRVVQGHVIQTGDGGESGRPTVKDEFNSHPHVAGALGLAHGKEPNSGSTEIYLCLAPRPHLDGAGGPRLAGAVRREPPPHRDRPGPAARRHHAPGPPLARGRAAGDGHVAPSRR